MHTRLPAACAAFARLSAPLLAHVHLCTLRCAQRRMRTLPSPASAIASAAPIPSHDCAGYSLLGSSSLYCHPPPPLSCAAPRTRHVYAHGLGTHPHPLPAWRILGHCHGRTVCSYTLLPSSIHAGYGSPPVVVTAPLWTPDVCRYSHLPVGGYYTPPHSPRPHRTTGYTDAVSC